MKTISLAIIGLFVSASAYAACPDLSGTFSCAYDDGTVDQMVISQTEANGVTTYTVNGNPIVADGVVQSIPDDAGARNQSVSYSCGDDNKFKYTYSAELYEANVMAGAVTADLLFSKDATTGGLVVEDVGTFSLTDGSVYPWASTVNCSVFTP